MVRAVVLDLWRTLAAWPDDESHDLRWSDRLGITVHPRGENPRWDGLGEWSGLRVHAVPQVLDLVA